MTQFRDVVEQTAREDTRPHQSLPVSVFAGWFSPVFSLWAIFIAMILLLLFPTCSIAFCAISHRSVLMLYAGFTPSFLSV